MNIENTPEYINKSIWYRGVVLHEICMMEVALNNFISNHFCMNSNKAFEMNYVILGDDRISINSKAQIFKHISDTHYQPWVRQYVSLRPKQHKKPAFTLSADLFYVIEQRNIFAHRVLDGDSVRITNPDFKRKEEDIRFIKMKNDIEPIDFNDVQITELTKLISHIRKYIIVNIK
jgi:hypothetical protein